MRLSTLKKQAQEATKHRGHRMSWGQPFGHAGGPYAVHGECRDCKAYAFVSEGPAPGRVGVFGLAVAVNCKDRG